MRASSPLEALSSQAGLQVGRSSCLQCPYGSILILLATSQCVKSLMPAFMTTIEHCIPVEASMCLRHLYYLCKDEVGEEGCQVLVSWTDEASATRACRHWSPGGFMARQLQQQPLNHAWRQDRSDRCGQQSCLAPACCITGKFGAM